MMCHNKSCKLKYLFWDFFLQVNYLFTTFTCLLLIPDLSLTNGVDIPCQNGVRQQTWSPQASYHQGHLLQYHHGNQLTVQSRQVSPTVSSPGLNKEENS